VITAALHFQAGCFLAEYAAMQQLPTTLNADLSPNLDIEINVSPADEVQNGQPAATALMPTNQPAPAVELGGRDGPDPTRFGDWEKAGRCIDF
jgi:hypothetical protein